MAICIYCKKQYFNYDSDAGTFKEMFCSEVCESENEKAIENSLTYTKDNQSLELTGEGRAASDRPE